jgi:peptidyl-prolyl cis-trans isomerase D
MFDAVRNNKRIVQVFLGLITLPFAFWGVDSYIRGTGAGSDLAKVGDTKISVQQFEQALRERQEQMRQAMGASFRPELMSSPEVRLGILNGLIDQRLLLLEASQRRLATNDGVLRGYIGAIPALQENGKFSISRYESVLRSQGMSELQFEARVRQDLTLKQLVDTVEGAAFVSSAQAEAMLRLQAEERQFSEVRIAAQPFLEKIKIEPATVQKFYDENKQRFEVQEQVKAEYVVLSLDALMPQVKVSEAEVKSWYEGHLDRYKLPEERRASHILILTNGEVSKEKAKAKADEVLSEVQKAPGKFADLAKKYSQDPGSAQKGGDLGFFGRGMMVKPFEDAVFSLKDGEMSALVESDFGFHIIKVTGVRAEKQRPLDDVRAEIEGELKRQAATRQFAEAAESFNNMVYEQSDSLQPVIEKFKLKAQQSDWLPKQADPQALAALGPLGNEKVLAGLFSEDAIKLKRNVEAVEVAPNTLVAARVLEHVPASVRPFETVRADVERLLKLQEAQNQAKSQGEARLVELNKGEDRLGWSASKSTSRMQASTLQLPPAAVQALFKADVSKLPAYVGVGVGSDYMLYKIVKVSQPEKIDENQLKALKSEYATIVAQEDLSAYVSGLRSRYKIDVNAALLETRERQ